MPVYNGEKYIRQSIDSILAQTYSNFEFIIINDGSTDRTEEIIKSYNDKRIIYHKNIQNLGLIKTLNLGLLYAKGDFIARMDHDDISLPLRFQEQLTFFKQYPETSIVGTFFKVIGTELIIKLPQSNKECKIGLLFNSVLGHPTVMFRRDIALKFNYDNKFTTAEDYKLWTDFAKNNLIICNIPKVLLHYRIHETQISTASSIEQKKTAANIRKEYWNYFFSDIVEKHAEFFEDFFYNNVSSQYKKSIFYELIKKNNRENFFDKSIFKERITKWREEIFLENYYKKNISFSILMRDNLFLSLILKKIKNKLKNFIQ